MNKQEVLHNAIARINRGIEMAAKAMDEKAVEELTVTLEALEKQVRKKVIIKKGWEYCPTCKQCLNDEYNTEQNHCDGCGQRLEW